ncbi:MAG TPA: secretin and TonB N-terminal domain-containing protein, partial [Puia sp.]|nr:secretin and TonB N-terminal domain-containing protein [Puia sp.]
MKLTFLLVLAGLLNASAKVNGQTAISLKVNDMEISRVLKSIEQQGNYRFLYNSRLGAIHEKVSVNLTNEPIDQALARILSGKDLTFKVLDNNLIVILSSTLQHQDITVTGLITGESGEGLPNVSIAVKGTTRGTTTDNNGNFTLTVPESATLVI